MTVDGRATPVLAKPKRTRKPTPEPNTLRDTLRVGQPLITAGFDILTSLPLKRPYLLALKLLATAGDAYLNNDHDDAFARIAKLKKLRKKVRALPADAHDERARLQAKIDKVLDKL